MPAQAKQKLLNSLSYPSPPLTHLGNLSLNFASPCYFFLPTFWWDFTFSLPLHGISIYQLCLEAGAGAGAALYLAFPERDWRGGGCLLSSNPTSIACLRHLHHVPAACLACPPLAVCPCSLFAGREGELLLLLFLLGEQNIVCLCWRKGRRGLAGRREELAGQGREGCATCHHPYHHHPSPAPSQGAVETRNKDGQWGHSACSFFTVPAPSCLKQWLPWQQQPSGSGGRRDILLPFPYHLLFSLPPPPSCLWHTVFPPLHGGRGPQWPNIYRLGRDTRERRRKEGRDIFLTCAFPFAHTHLRYHDSSDRISPPFPSCLPIFAPCYFRQ